MVIINDSYSVLSDPDKRKKHDEWIAGYETKSPHRGSGTRQDHEEWQSKRTEERNERRRRGSVNTYDKDGYTPLMRAVKQMDIDAVRDLLELGADPKLEDANFGTSTALSMARRLFSISKDSRARSIYQDIINILKPIT
jgi:DnaJ-class molecular chaperone